jgi:hypothetical protein
VGGEGELHMSGVISHDDPAVLAMRKLRNEELERKYREKFPPFHPAVIAVCRQVAWARNTKPT